MKRKIGTERQERRERFPGLAAGGVRGRRAVWGLLAAFWLLSAMPGKAQADVRLDFWTRNLNHPELSVRKSAVKKLGELGDPAAVSRLLALLQDPLPEIRRLAVESLGRIKDTSVLDQLERVARDDNDRQVRLAATKSVDSLRAVIERRKTEEEKAKARDKGTE